MRHDDSLDPKTNFLTGDSPRRLFVLNIVLAIVYFIILTFYFPHGSEVLFYLLVAGEVFHLWQVFTFIYTVWDTGYVSPRSSQVKPMVDVFITVAGEPTEVVEPTARAAATMEYPNFRVFLLNDGLVARRDNWYDMETLAARLRREGLNVSCITRTVQGGAKAGNINHALSLTSAPLIAIFDADHVPHKDFLTKTVAYFVDTKVGFVQTPQYYKNARANYLTQGSWEQQELFFGPICRGKNRLNAATMCGTNMLISRQALQEVGGMCADSIAEDFVTGLFMHAKQWKSVYHAEVLAEGLAAEDFLSYSKQQFRWARGALDVIFRYNPLFMQGLTWAQRIQYLASASFYLSGAVVAIDIALPIIFLFTGLVPIVAPGMLLATIFLPYMFITLYTIQLASNYTFTFPSLGLSMSAFTIHLRALWAAMTRQKSNFSVTAKAALSGNFIKLSTVHITYIVLTVVGVGIAFVREGMSASLINNIAWAGLNIGIFIPFIRSSLPARASTRATPAPLPAQAGRPAAVIPTT